jgi:acetyl-CoA acetyltransferase
MREIVIVSAVRTPVGRAFKGTLRTSRPDELAAIAYPGVDIEERKVGYAAVEFFTDLSADARFRSLAKLQPSAGRFPQTGAGLSPCSKR